MNDEWSGLSGSSSPKTSERLGARRTFSFRIQGQFLTGPDYFRRSKVYHIPRNRLPVLNRSEGLSDQDLVAQVMRYLLTLIMLDDGL